MEGGRELVVLLLEFLFLSREFGAREQDGPGAKIDIHPVDSSEHVCAQFSTKGVAYKIGMWGNK